MYISVCSGHTGCGKVLHGMIHSQQNFYFDGHVRYRKSKDIMMTALKNGIKRDRHTTYLYPPMDLNPSSALGRNRMVTRLKSSAEGGAPCESSGIFMDNFTTNFSAKDEKC